MCCQNAWGPWALSFRFRGPCLRDSVRNVSWIEIAVGMAHSLPTAYHSHARSLSTADRVVLVSGHYTRSDPACSSLWGKKEQTILYAVMMVPELAFVLCPFHRAQRRTVSRSVKGSCPNGVKTSAALRKY